MNTTFRKMIGTNCEHKWVKFKDDSAAMHVLCFYCEKCLELTRINKEYNDIEFKKEK